MTKLNKIAKRTDYSYILSLTFISKEKQSAKLAEEKINKQFQEEMTQQEFNEKCTGVEKVKTNIELQ
jgi:hypothetical protein